MEKIFNNTEIAFSLKSDTELERGYFLFKLIEKEPLVKIGTAVTNFALKAHLPVEGLIRSTVFVSCAKTHEAQSITTATIQVDFPFRTSMTSIFRRAPAKPTPAAFGVYHFPAAKLLEFRFPNAGPTRPA